MDAVNANGHTPLHAAIYKEDHGMARELLAKNADPNVKDADGDTCLMLAISRRNEACVRVLLEGGADVNATDSTGDSCLHVAIHKGVNREIVQALVAGGPPDRLNALNKKFQTPLLLAVGKRQKEAMNVLLDAGADPDIADEKGNTCLHVAIHQDFKEAVPPIVEKSKKINAMNDSKETALFLACGNKMYGVVKALLAAQADPNIVCQDESVNCLHLACSLGDTQLFDILLPASKDVDAVTLKQHSPILLACSKKNVEIVKSLLKAGATPNVHDKSMETPLHIATMKHVPELVSILLEHTDEPLDVNVQNRRQHTPLFIACAKGYTDIARQLMEKGADVNIKDEKLNTPLHMAILHNSLDVIDDLLKHKADLNIAGQQGITPLHAAILQGTDEAVKRLLGNNPAPDIDAVDCDGDTPLHVASRVPGRTTKSVQLVQKGANLRKLNSSRHTPFDYLVRRCDRSVLEACVRKDPTIVNVLLDSHETALHFFCRKGNADMVKWLVGERADKNMVCVRGSPLDAALDHGQKEIVLFLIDAGADISSSSDKKIGFVETIYRQRLQHMDILKHMIESNTCELDLTAQNDEGQTLFFQACRDEADDVIELMLTSKRDIGINIPNKFGVSPVSLVCESAVKPKGDSLSVLSMLLQSGRAVDVDARDVDHVTPLHIVSRNGSQLMANMLLRASKKSINAGDRMKRTPLHIARSPELVKLLVDFGAGLDKRDYLGLTPLLLSCQQKRTNVAKALIKLQPDAINSHDHMRRTVTHHCTASQILDILSDVRGLQINVADINNQTALHIAVMNKDLHSTKELLKMGANPNVTDKCNLSPLHMAQTQEMYDLLKEHNADSSVRSIHDCSSSDMLEWYKQHEQAKTRRLSGLLSAPNHNLEKIIKMHLVGFIEAHEKHEREYHEIRRLLRKFMTRVSEEVVKIDPLMEFVLMPSGSMNEDTKVCMPDEGDFICLLTKVSKMFEPPKKFSFQTANVTLNLRHDFVGERPDFVDANGRAVTRLVFYHFYRVIQQALVIPNIWKQYYQLYRAAADDITMFSSKITPVNLYWHGSIFKWMDISVDIVPGIFFPEETTEKGEKCERWLPSWCEEREVLQDTQCCIVAKDIDNAPEDKRPYLFQLGFTEADAEMFRRMKPHFKDGYKVAKIMRLPTVCTQLKTERRHRRLKEASSYISSYMLKTITFHLHEESQKSPEKFSIDRTQTDGYKLAIQVAGWIYRKLEDALKENFLEMYAIPAHDLFRNHYKVGKDDEKRKDDDKKKDDELQDYQIAMHYVKKIRKLLEIKTPK